MLSRGLQIVATRALTEEKTGRGFLLDLLFRFRCARLWAASL